MGPAPPFYKFVRLGLQWTIRVAPVVVLPPLGM